MEKKHDSIKSGDYIFFPKAVRAGVYKVFCPDERSGILGLYRNSTYCPLTSNLEVQVIRQPFDERWERDWEDVESVISQNMRTGETKIDFEVMIPWGDYSGYSDWYAYNKNIFPYEELTLQGTEEVLS